MSTEEGFLGDMPSSFARIQADFAPWIKHVRDVNRLAMALLEEMNPDRENHQHVVMAMLYGRALHSIQAAFLLAVRGLWPDARTVLRSATETAIILAAIAKDPSVIDKLVLRDAISTRARYSSVLNNPKDFGDLPPEKIKKWRKAIADLEAMFPELKKLKGNRDPVNIADLARRNGILMLYDAIYRKTSFDAAHATYTALHRHAKTDVNKKMSGFRFGTSAVDAPETFSHMATVLIHAADVVVNAFAIDTHRPALQTLLLQWRSLGDPADYTLPPESPPTST